MFPDILIYCLDILGVIVCAVAGTLLAQHKGLDMLGCLLVAMVNAIGGGTIRDVLLDRRPVFWMNDLNYLLVITITSFLVMIFFDLFNEKIDWTLKIFDAMGLAAFSVIGFTVGLAQGVHPTIAIMMAVCTAIAGGMMRDIICNEIPLVLRQEVYITACIIGCCCYMLMENYLQLHTDINKCVMLIIIFGVRVLAIIYDWQLPSIRLVKK